MNTRDLRIDQALFGYREGHRLLQASRKFAPTTERSLQTLTDMSGSRMVDGFEEYISGYPVPGEKSYALVKTWYAPEMERPGCVWSHVLILRREDVAAIKDVSELIPLFERPVAGHLERYASPAFADLPDVSVSMPNMALADAEALIAAVYGLKEKPVIIPAKSAQMLEALVLATWSQQWPALRAEFRFCTGSLSNRTYGGKPFDLQVVPHSLMRELQRDQTSFLFQSIPDNNRTLSGVATWVQAGAADLLSHVSPFRDFLWKYADACAGGRSLYSKLAELFKHFHAISTSPTNEELSQITRWVTEIYPEATCGAVLKQELYGDLSSAKSALPFIGEESRLRELAKTRYWSSFSAAQLALRDRARKLWLNTPLNAKHLLLDLLDSSTNPLADEIITGSVGAMSVSEVCQFVQERNGLLLALVTHAPEIVLSEAFWRCRISLDAYYSVLDFLKSEAPAAPVPTNWIPFIIDSGVEGFAVAVVERFAPEAIHSFLKRALIYSGGEDWIPAPSWRAALSQRQMELHAVLGSEEYADSNRALTLIAGLLDSHYQQPVLDALHHWSRLAKEASELIFLFPKADAAAFLLSIGFQLSQLEAIELVRVCFEHVHAAAKDESLSYRAWRNLEADIPALLWRNWDKCERLRQALVAHFMRNGWPRQELLRCLFQPTTLRSVLYSCREVRGGEDFIRVVAEGVLSGELNATEGQAAVFRASFRRNRRGELKLDL